MSTHFWFGGEDTPYLVKKSTRFDDANLSRTPSDSDPHQYGETGEISSAITNITTGTKVIPAAIGVVTYTGNGTSQDITGLGFSPDLVWVKARTFTYDHNLTDSVRGSYYLSTSGTSAQSNGDTVVSSLDADGFSVGSSLNVNSSGSQYIAWCWDAGDTTVTNTEGSVESQVRSNGTFSICTFPAPDGIGGDATFGHGLNTAPAMVITKSLITGAWYVYHQYSGADPTRFYTILNDASPSADAGEGGAWVSAPTDTLFTYGTNFSSGAGTPVVAYCWTESPTQSFGSYTGTEAEQTITLGFAPAFVLIKSATGGEQWYVYDTTRQTSNTYPYLRPNLSDTEESLSSRNIELTDSGFTVVGADGSINTNNNTYIYAAFAAEATIETTSNTTTLQFNEPTSLDQDLKTELFAAGETVYQDSAYTATSDDVSAVTVIGPEYKIANSLRFNGVDSYLNRTPSVAGSTTTFSLSMWVKIADLDAAIYLYTSGSGTQGYLTYDVGQIRFWGGTAGDIKTSATYADPSAWLHIVAVADTTNVISDDRMRLYVNGERITALAINTQPTQGASLGSWNTADVQYINRVTTGSYSEFYQSDVQFIDGLAVSPQEFGKYDSDGKWVAKEYVTSTSTSAITGVADASIPAQDFSGLDRSSDTMTYYSGNYVQLFNGDTINGPSWSNGGSQLGVATLFELNNSSILSSLEFMMTGDADFGVKITDGDGTVHEIPNFSGPGGGVYTSVPISGISSVKKVQVEGYGNAFGMYTLKLNGVQMIDNTEIIMGKVLTLTDDTGLDEFFVGNTVDNGSAADGEVIAVDSTGNTLTLTNVTGTWSNGETATKSIPYGTNGFHLPFDPAATGGVFSSFLTALNGTIYDNNVVSFNGDTSTWTSTLDSSTMVFAPTQAIVVNTSFGYHIPNSPFVQWIRVTLDGASVDLNVSSDIGLYFINEFVGKTISSSTPLTIETLTSTRTECNFGPLEIDGGLLVDHNSIGVDDSGNENNFHDQNFVTGNTSQVWSNSVTSTSTYVAGSSAAAMFNGIAAAGSQNRAETTPPGTVTFTSPVQQSGGLRLFMACGARGTAPSGNFDLKLDGVSVFDNASFPNNASAWVDFGAKTWTTLSFGSESGGDWMGIAAIELDGVLLVDANIQDTVVDSPTPYGTDTGRGGEVRGNYATLNPLHQTENYSQAFDMGNLRNLGGSNGAGGWGTSFSTIPYPSTGKWYYEATLKSDFNQVNNYQGCGFGTADSRYAYNQVMIIDFGDGVEYYPDSTATSLFPVNTVALNDTVGWAVDMDNWTYSIYINGVVSVVSDRPIPFPQGTLLFPSATAYNLDYGYWVYNFGQRQFVNQAPTGFQALCTTNIAAQGG